MKNFKKVICTLGITAVCMCMFTTIAKAYSVTVNEFWLGRGGKVKKSANYTAYGEIHYNSAYAFLPVPSKSVYRYSKTFYLMGKETKYVKANGVGESFTTTKYEGYCGTGSGHDADNGVHATLQVVK